MKSQIEQTIIKYIADNWDIISNEGITSKFLQSYLSKKGWKPSSIRSAISRMTKRGLLKKVDNGYYMPSKLLQKVSTGQEKERVLIEHLFSKIRIQNVVVKAKIKGKIEERISLKWEPIEKFLKLTIEGKDNLGMAIKLMNIYDKFGFWMERCGLIPTSEEMREIYKEGRPTPLTMEEILQKIR